MKRRILVIDDTRNVQLMLEDFLSGQEFEVSAASDGIKALELFKETQPDLILLDIMMPNMDGFQFLGHLRKQSSTPVIMITARDKETDIVHGFELGADDYIVKPFKLRELLVRIRAVMRRAGVTVTVDNRLTVGEVTLDPGRHEVSKDSHVIEVTPIEFQILEILMQAHGQVVRKEDMSMRLMDFGYAGSESTLKIHIRNLRTKLGDDLEEPRFIETVFGVGYRFLEVAG